MPQIKICGITREEELLWLSENSVEYAGFVLYEKSKRFISISKTKELIKKLNQKSKKVAVTVKPTLQQIRQIEEAGFDIVQIHGEVTGELLSEIRIPVWLAVNISSVMDLNKIFNQYVNSNLPGSTVRGCGKDIIGKYGVEALVVDAGSFGSGRTFGWEQMDERELEQLCHFQSQLNGRNIKFVLAGGLHAENAAEGIRIFQPDIVDVSSGVECSTDAGDEINKISPGKDRNKIHDFVTAVRNMK